MIASVRINHMIIGVGPKHSMDAVADFYGALLGVERLGPFVDSRSGGTGMRIGFGKAAHGDPQFVVPGFEILLVPMNDPRLPNPQHLAFEVSSADFESVLTRAKSLGLPIRSEPALTAPATGERGRLDLPPFHYEQFYVLDPAGVNVEFLTRRQ